MRVATSSPMSRAEGRVRSLPVAGLLLALTAASAGCGGLLTETLPEPDPAEGSLGPITGEWSGGCCGFHVPRERGRTATRALQRPADFGEHYPRWREPAAVFEWFSGTLAAPSGNLLPGY